MNAPADIPAPLPRRPRNLAQGLVESFSERIRGGQIRPGEKLPTESELMRQFGVSRTVVREALSRLQARAWSKPITAWAPMRWSRAAAMISASIRPTSPRRAM